MLGKGWFHHLSHKNKSKDQHATQWCVSYTTRLGVLVEAVAEGPAERHLPVAARARPQHALARARARLAQPLLRVLVRAQVLEDRVLGQPDGRTDGQTGATSASCWRRRRAHTLLFRQHRPSAEKGVGAPAAGRTPDRRGKEKKGWARDEETRT